jgi:hypothetical protein
MRCKDWQGEAGLCAGSAPRKHRNLNTPADFVDLIQQKSSHTPKLHSEIPDALPRKRTNVRFATVLKGFLSERLGTAQTVRATISALTLFMTMLYVARPAHLRNKTLPTRNRLLLRI